MSFLAPLFLFGALAVAGPVIFHLIRRTTRDRVRFSSLMFLLPTPPRLTRRSRIEHWLLLLLRAAALALLALAFARPFLQGISPAAPTAGSGTRTVLLVDVSASMRRDGLWQAAKEKARTVVRAAQESDEVAVMTFDRSVRPLLSFDEWRAAEPGARAALAGSRLDTASPTWTGTDLAGALMTGAELLAEAVHGATAAARRLVLVSDLQEGSRLEALQSYEWPKGVEITLETLTPKNTGNAGLQIAAESSETGAAPEAGVRLRVTNAAGGNNEKFQTGWAGADGSGFAGPAQDVYVPPGQSRAVTVPWPQGGPAAGRLLLRGDAEPFDNVVYVAPPAVTNVSLIYCGGELPDDSTRPLYFLRKALPQSSTLTVTIVPHTVEKPAASDEWKRAGFFIVTAPLAEDTAATLREQLQAGRSALLVLNSDESAATLAALSGTNRSTLEEIKKPASYAMFGEIDFRHPVFAPFADPRFSDFTKIRFWKYRKLDAASLHGASILAKFDSGDPALVETPVGRGRLVVLASGWTPEESQLAVSSKFPPLLAAILEWSGAAAAPPTRFIAGEPLPRVALGPADAVLTVRRPDGTTVALPAEAKEFSATDQPGFYEISGGGAARTVPVNLDPAESRTSPLSSDDFERLGAPLARNPDAAPSKAATDPLATAAESEGRQKLWKWILLAALVVLFIESLLAGRAARRALVLTEVTP